MNSVRVDRMKRVGAVAAWLCCGAVAAAANVAVTVNPAANRRAVSPYIYGQNDLVTSGGQPRVPRQGLARAGGNRFSGFNWENNASNAGTDFGPNSSDDYICQAYGCPNSETAGASMQSFVTQAHAMGSAALLTVPIGDYVAADKNGNVNQPATVDPSRWKANRPRKGSALSLSPDKTDAFVNEDEFVNFIETAFASARAQGKQVFYDLDNEPGLWPVTHPMLHPAQPTYAEMASRTLAYSSMIKDANPNAMVFGGVCYGFGEYVVLQNAPDAGGRDYLNFLMDQVKTAETSQGRRLMDVLDLHWYPEATTPDGSVRITDDQGSSPSQAVIDARVQAPRSLWDPTYRETSWIADYLNGPIQLLPWLQGKIAAHDPGVQLGFSEYNYGGEGHISGGVAQADVLGVFGREGVFSANLWLLGSMGANSFLFGAFDSFLNYDGAGSAVGDTSVSAQNSDIVKTSFYGLVNGADNTRLWLIAINKTTATVTANISLAASQSMTQVKFYQLTSAAKKPQAAGSAAVAGNQLTYAMPPLSVTTMAFDTGTGSTGGAPAAPTAFTAAATSATQIGLSWTHPGGNVTGFRIERGVSGGAFQPLTTAAAAARSYQDAGLMPQTRYDYRITAFNGQDSASLTAGATTPAGSSSGGGSGGGSTGGGSTGGGATGSGGSSSPAVDVRTRLLSPGRTDGRNDVAAFSGASEVEVVDERGRRVFRGSDDPVWDGRDEAGRTLPSGLYVARVKDKSGAVRYEKILIVK